MLFRLFIILLFVIFYSIYFGKLHILKGKQIKAVHLGQRKLYSKEKIAQQFMSGIAFSLVLYQIYILFFDFHVDNRFYTLGIVIIILGIVIFGLSVSEMKDSWRVGFEKSDRTTLITKGIYAYSRNPAYLGFFLFNCGYLFLIGDAMVVLLILVDTLSLHYLVLSEEKHLRKMFQKEYDTYYKKTRRYL